MKIIYSKKCSEYGQMGHPESPVRVTGTYDYLLKKNWEFVNPAGCRTQDILRAHTRSLLDEVKSGGFNDPDTPDYNGIYEYAVLSAGAACMAGDGCFNEPHFSLMRPPGHHATRSRLGGFCYFNNIAISVLKLLSEKDIGRAAILDIDCHHGNGTQDIFLGDKRALFVSLHQVPLYPGTGHRSQDNCLNFPLSPGTDEKMYMSVLDTAIGKIREFGPEVLAVSAGFDTYRGDPLTQMNLEKTTYRKIGEHISELNLPRYAVLEGGYSPDLPECIYNFLVGFGG
ncbi:MAG: histone deacetylase [Elusimicrobia bacterium]|nr:histone deacetylase [Elusimicrobiota bacterium]